MRRASPATPHHLTGFDPPAPGVDADLDAVAVTIKRADPDGALFAAVLRETFDQLYDGQRTGRFRWEQLRKTEKTYMGTVVEINLHRAFDFSDGEAMDYRIASVETDCKFSQSLGGWEIPPEAYEGGHLCLVVWASETYNRWEAGLIRARGGDAFLGPPNRDRKRKLTPQAESQISWLYDTPDLPENLLLHISEKTRERIFSPDGAGPNPSGQAKINELFRLVQRRLVNRASVLTVAQQRDSLKRARDARLPQHLGQEGILVFGHQEDDPRVAEDLGLPVPAKGDFVGARVVPAERGFSGPIAEIGGELWRIAQSGDPVLPAPSMRRVRRRS